MCVAILRATPNETIEISNVLKNIMNKSKWNARKCSGNPREDKGAEKNEKQKVQAVNSESFGRLKP